LIVSVARVRTNRVEDWPWSSFHRDARMGFYAHDWGGSVEAGLQEMMCGE
jgi:hypothetical protein